MSSLVWVELDRNAPDHNVKELLRCASSGVMMCAVVKSNAYGHGVAQMVELLPSARWFAVNSLDEGLELRRLGVKKPVLILGYVPLGRLREAVEADLRLTVFNRESVRSLSRLRPGGLKAKVHLKVETGTNRQGVPLEKLEEFVRYIRTNGNVALEGVSTHFANIEDTLNHGYAERQLDTFRRALGVIRRAGENPKVIHTACTAADILFAKTHFSMLRPGIGVYGLWPSRETYLSTLLGNRPVPVLKPVLTWKTKVVQIKTVEAGSFIGYGCTYKTTRRIKLAVLPVGYADGYDRELGNKAHVIINERRAPVIGRVCMNLIMADVSDVPGVKLENDVVLLGRWGGEVVTAEMMAGWAGTINYEIVTRISPFLERRVVQTTPHMR
jgi:alanine racemase